MKQRGIIRAMKCPWSRNEFLLRLMRVDEDGSERLLATSSAVTKVAAAALTRTFANSAPVRFDLEAVSAVLEIPGRTAWASFTDLEPARAALKACVQHELRRARGVLVLISLSCNSNIVHDLRSILNVVHPHIGAQTPSACITTYDDALVREVRVELLLPGM